jgi:hypothetical protein
MIIYYIITISIINHYKVLNELHGSCIKPLSTLIKDTVKSVLSISSAHYKGGPADINIAQILHLSNFFELKRRVYIHLQV